MPVLDDAQEELYAQSRAKGKSQMDSYVAAGFKPDDGHASRYEAGNGRIEARIKELLEEIAKAAKVDAVYITKKLRMLVERCTQAEPVLDKKGNVTGEYKMDSAGANSSIDKLARNIGYYKKDNEQGNGMSQDEWVKMILKDREND